MPNNTEVIEYTTYINKRTDERREERRVLDIPFEEARGRELALLQVPRSGQDRDDYRSNNDRYALQRSRRSVDLRRREPSQSESDGDSDSDSSRHGRRHRHRRGHRRARSEQPPPPASSAQTKGNNSGVLWYSMKSRDEGNWVEKNFDSSYDGLIAAAAGAALGAMTARRFGGEGERSKWKVLGGAVAGAASMNAAENWFRVYTEEREERKEEKREECQERREQRQGVRG